MHALDATNAISSLPKRIKNFRNCKASFTLHSLPEKFLSYFLWKSNKKGNQILQLTEITFSLLRRAVHKWLSRLQ